MLYIIVKFIDIFQFYGSCASHNIFSTLPNPCLKKLRFVFFLTFIVVQTERRLDLINNYYVKIFLLVVVRALLITLGQFWLCDFCYYYYYCCNYLDISYVL